MAKNKITIDIEVNGKMQKATVEAGKLQKQLDGVSKGQDKVSKSARTADRNLKGAAQASSNSTKNFSKMAQGITGGLVPAYATLAANLFAVSAAFQFLKNASQTERLKQAQIEYAASTGNALGYLSTELQKASQGMLSFKEASAASAIGAAKGFSAKQMQELAVSAGKVSKVLGRDFTDAFDRLVRGVSKAEPELLDELGVTLRLEKATKRYADALGLNEKKLSDFQRSQAILLETQRQINEQFGDIEPDADPFVKLSKTFDDLIQKIASGILPAFQSIATVINNNAELALGAFAGFSMMILKSIIPMDSLKESMDEWGTKAKQNYKAAGDALETYKTKLLRSKMTSAQFKVEGYGVAQGLAQQSPLAGKKGEAKFMKALRLEADLTKREMARMSQAITGALRNIDKQGIVTTGAFKGMTKEMVLEMQEANLKIRNQWALTDSKLQAKFKQITYGSKIAAAWVAVHWQKAAKAVVAAVTLATRGFNIVLRVVTALFSAKFFLELLDDIKILGLNIIKIFSGIIEFVTGWNPFGNWASDKIDQIKADMKFNEELQEMKDNFTSTIDAIVKQIDAATSKGLNFQKMVNTLSQVDILGVRDQKTDLEEKIKSREADKGFFTRMWEKVFPDTELEDLKKKAAELDTKLRGIIPPGIMNKGTKAQNAFIQSTKEVAAVQQEFKNSLTAVSEATAEGNIRNMAAAQDQANKAYLKAVNILGVYTAELINTGASSEVINSANKAIADLTEKNKSIFDGENLVAQVKAFDDEIKRITKQGADIDIKVKKLDAAGLSKLEKEEKLEQYKIDKQILAIDKAKNALAEHNLAMEKRSSKEKDAAKIAADQQRQEELTAAVKVAEQEGVRLVLNKQINDEVRKHQNTLNNLTGLTKIVNVEKQILDLKQKQLDAVKARMDLEASRAQRQFDKDIRASRGFFNVVNPQKEAQMKIDLEKKLQAFKLNAAQKEFDIKQKQIQSEYKLLRLRNQIAITEAQKKLAGKDLSTGEITQQNALIDMYKQVNTELAGAEAAALDAQRLRMENTKEEAAAVIQALKNEKTDLSAWRQLGSEFRGSFTSELSNFFDEWNWGDTDEKFKDIAKRFGNNIAKTLNKKANDMIAESVTEMLFGGMSASSKMAMAFETGGTSAALKIQQALSGAQVQMQQASSSGGGGIWKTLIGAAASAWGNVSTAYRYDTNVGSQQTSMLAEQDKGLTWGEWRNGGITPMPSYASGGVAKGSTSGYPAMLHGNEAVVPLGRGNSIPVDLKNAGNNNINNVSVTVNTDNSQQSTSNTNAGKNLGAAIAAAVQKELVNQKRAGGILAS